MSDRITLTPILSCPSAATAAAAAASSAGAAAATRAWRRRAAAGMLLAVCGTLWGCSSVAPKLPEFLQSPTSMAGTISASERLNVGALKHSSPVVLHIYQLRSATSFEAADFLSLFEREQQTLAGDLVERQELVLRPGETQQLASRNLNPATRSIGVIAAFQNLERASWRVAVPVRLNSANKLAIRLEDAAVTVTVQP